MFTIEPLQPLCDVILRPRLGPLFNLYHSTTAATAVRCGRLDSEIAIFDAREADHGEPMSDDFCDVLDVELEQADEPECRWQASA